MWILSILFLCYITAADARVALLTSGLLNNTAPVHSASSHSGPSPYCPCGTSGGQPVGWNFNEIWVDIVIILDTSEAMGEASLYYAGRLIESFLSDGANDFLNTDTDAVFYSRVGVIAMSDTATPLYNLNMTKKDIIQGKVAIKKGVAEMNFEEAFHAATQMHYEGRLSIPERDHTRQVIYFMTDSKPKDISDGDIGQEINTFKDYYGAIIVNEFRKEGDMTGENYALENLASIGYYFLNGDYITAGLQPFCKANCFCMSKMEYSGGDAAKAGGGCYRGSAKDVPFNKAKEMCATGGGIMSVIHDQNKAKLLQIAEQKIDYFWIGYQKSDSGDWNWQDGSSDPYTNWGVDEPSPNAVAKCAYADNRDPKNLIWGAGNCQVAFPYICEYPPCQAGIKDC